MKFDIENLLNKPYDDLTTEERIEVNVHRREQKNRELDINKLAKDVPIIYAGDVTDLAEIDPEYEKYIIELKTQNRIDLKSSQIREIEAHEDEMEMRKIKMDVKEGRISLDDLLKKPEKELTRIEKRLVGTYQTKLDFKLKEQKGQEYQDYLDATVVNRIDKFRLSFIEDYEEEEACKLIEESLGFERPRPVGYRMAVKIYTRPEDVVKVKGPDGKERSLYLPAVVRADDKFKNCSALVVAQGPDCYKDPKRTSAPWCKVGDWVVIARNAGPQVNYKGVPMTIIPDDAVYLIIQDPNDVTRD